MQPLIIEVPSPLGLRPTGVELTPEVLRAAGLHARLGCADAEQVAVPPYDARRDTATGVLNPRGIAAVAHSLADTIEAALQANRLPVVIGGDCSILLGPLLALRRAADMAWRTWMGRRISASRRRALIVDRALATVTKPEMQGFWVHFDVDVLDDAIMPAVDYRQEAA